MTDTNNITSKSNGKYTENPGWGTLFAGAAKDTGELHLSGSFMTPEGLLCKFTGQLSDDGKSVTLVGEIPGMKGSVVTGYLSPDDSIDGGTYKRGEITVAGKKASMTYKVNSKVMEDRNGLPLRRIWMSRNEKRVAW